MILKNIVPTNENHEQSRCQSIEWMLTHVTSDAHINLISSFNRIKASAVFMGTRFICLDSIYKLPSYFGMDHLSLFTLLMTATSLVNAFITPQPQSQDNPGMKYMPYIFPIMLFFMFNSFSAALTYYYLLFNVFSIIQVWVIKKFFINEEKLKAEIHPKKNAPAEKRRLDGKIGKL